MIPHSFTAPIERATTSYHSNKQKQTICEVPSEDSYCLSPTKFFDALYVKLTPASAGLETYRVMSVAL